MEFRTLGRSGCAVSTFALGTMTFGYESDESASNRQLDRFVEVGGNFIDTADVYTLGASEEIIGRWLAKRPASVRDQIVLATKGASRWAAGPTTPACRAAASIARCRSRSAVSASRRSICIKRTRGIR
jgi:aryl-alcohol dehydrogenase-like predicted oxidoreductase